MGEATWILIFNIFVSVFLVIRPSEFPAFFDDDDLKSMGVKGHRSHYNPPTATGRYTDHVPGYFTPVKSDQNDAIRPPNGLAVPYKPPQMFNKKQPFKPLGRGDPRDQNLVEQMEDDEADAIFPHPDGKPYGGDDTANLDQLPKRLTETGKWAEFKELVAEEAEKYKDGQIMENWEDDAHMWAGYSKHLLERAEHENQKKASRQMRPTPPKINPSAGLSAYWGDDEDTDPAPSSPVGPWGQPPAAGEGFDYKKFDTQDPSMAKPKASAPKPGGASGPGIPWGHTPRMGHGSGGGSNRAGPPPPGWGQGGGQSPRDFFMGGPPPPGWKGGGIGPGGSMKMGGPPHGRGQGGGKGPGGAVKMGGPPPGWGQSGSQSRPNGGMNMGGPPPGWGQSGASSPGSDWGNNGGQGPSEGWGQGGPSGPGGNWDNSQLSGLGPGGPNPLGGWGQDSPPGPGGGWGPNGPGLDGRRAQSQGPIRKPMKWNRRQMEENMPDYDNRDDNLKGPLNHPLPPLYYQGNNPEMPNFQPGLPEDKMPTGQDDRWMLPGQEGKPESDPTDFRSNNMQRLKPRPDSAGSFVLDNPEGDRRPAFDESIQPAQIPGYSGGNMPGPGSERDFPNGYIPNHASSPLQMFQNIMNQDPSGRQQNQAKGPFGEKYPKAMAAALREGRSIPGIGDYSDPGDPGDYPEMQKALRMGGPGGFQGQSGPGSETHFPGGYRPSLAGANVQRGPPPNYGNVNRGRPSEIEDMDDIQNRSPPGMHHSRYPEWKHMYNEVPPEYDERLPPGMQAGSQGAWQGPPGMSDFSPPGEPAFQPPGMGEDGRGLEMPPGMRPGPVPGRGGPPPDQSYPEYPDGPSPGGGNQALRSAIESPGLETGQSHLPPRNRNLPSGYTLMRIAQQKLAAQNRITGLRERAPSTTTTEHIPTKEEMINALPLYDDFTAPVRWVPLNSQDTRDGLARLMDRKTHKNQQYIIQGEMYVPIVDDSMSRLGWTTENLNATITEAPFKAPVDDTAIVVVMRNLNLNHTDEQEWLAYETILGPKHRYGSECDAESCQSRCYKTGCDSVCKGDTCAAGCVGVSCNAVCKAPGCFAMCIGEQCSAKCEGLNCESRCWGQHCDATCKKLSCAFTVNGGSTKMSNTTWEQLYPEYDHKFSNPDVPQHQQANPAPDNNDYYGE